MSEKEKRILVLTTHNEDGECECVMQDGCHANDSCAICNVGMTRQEAIERMAKALCAENLSHSCEDCMRNGTNDCFINEKEDFYKSLAEAALNALLEGE